MTAPMPPVLAGKLDGSVRRPLPADMVRRFALAEECLRATRIGHTPINTIEDLTAGAWLVELRPVEFARFALAVASVRWQQG